MQIWFIKIFLELIINIIKLNKIKIKFEYIKKNYLPIL